jgi:hypothetical protein
LRKTQALAVLPLRQWPFLYSQTRYSETIGCIT